MKIALVQSSSSSDIEANLDSTESLIVSAAGEGAQIVALQELFHTPYFCREVDPKHFELAEPVPGPLTERLCRIAASHQVVIVAPMFERQAAGLYFNTSVVIDADGTLMGRYRKMHIPDDPGFYEKYYFTPGDSGYKVFNTRYGRIGTLICWDQWFPEAARITSMMGADLLLYPTAIATLPEEDEDDRRHFLEAWKTIQRSHAIANGCYVAAINRVGKEGGLSFWGNSFVAGPFGEIVAEAGSEERILLAELDLEKIESQRQTWPFFRDRRVDSYTPLEKRWL